MIYLPRIQNIPLMSLVLFVSCILGPAQASERTVSLNGSLTEIVYALGLEAKLVGVDTTSQYPLAATELASVGYQRALNAEGIVSLQPTLLLSTNHAGPKAALEQVVASGVERLLVDEKYSVDGVLEKIKRVSQAMGVVPAGDALATQVAADLKAVQRKIPDNGGKPRTLFFLGTGTGSPSVAGADTGADAIITLAGGHNPFNDNYSGYKPVNAESLFLAAPEVILVSSRAFETAGGLEGILALPGVASTPAGLGRRIYSVDTLLALGFGPRLPQAINTLVNMIHFSDE